MNFVQSCLCIFIENIDLLKYLDSISVIARRYFNLFVSPGQGGLGVAHDSSFSVLVKFRLYLAFSLTKSLACFRAGRVTNSQVCSHIWIGLAVVHHIIPYPWMFQWWYWKLAAQIHKGNRTWSRVLNIPRPGDLWQFLLLHLVLLEMVCQCYSNASIITSKGTG
jgi:hypothetical protein